MNRKMQILKIVFIGLILIGSWAALAIQDAGETVIKRGIVNDDYYAFAGSVSLDAEFAGDVVVAGGDLFIANQVYGDVMAAGGSIQLSGEIHDDVRTAGGDITINAKIGDDLFAAGGTIWVASGSVVEGMARLAGGDIHMAGAVKEDLFIAAGNIRISGIIDGDVELLGEEIKILEGAVIKGNLLYRSPSEANISPDVKIVGKVTFEKETFDKPHKPYGVFFATTLIVASIVLYRLFPNFTMASTTQILSNTWKSMAVGMVCLFVAPAAAVLLIMTVLGVWIGLSIMALYFVALLVGLLISVFFIGDWATKRLHMENITKQRRLLFVGIVIFLLALINLIPVVGGLLIFALLLLGLGAGVLQLKLSYNNANR